MLRYLLDASVDVMSKNLVNFDQHFFMILISKPGVGILVNDFIFMDFLHKLFFFKCNFCVVHFLLKTYMRPWKENLTETSVRRIQCTSWFTVPKIIFVKSLTKGPLLALRKFLTTESLLKIMKKMLFIWCPKLFFFLRSLHCFHKFLVMHKKGLIKDYDWFQNLWRHILDKK